MFSHVTVLYGYLKKTFKVSSTGMKFFMDLFQPVLINMGVDLGSGDVGMAEHELN